MTDSQNGSFPRLVNWILLALLAVSIPANGLVYPLAYFDQNIYLLLVSTAFLLTWFCIVGIALTLPDVNLLKRVLVALVIPTVLFGLTFALGIFIARRLHPLGPQFQNMSKLGLNMPLLCMSVAWILWLLRIFRGWRLTWKPEPEQLGESSEEGRTLEIFCLTVCLAAALSLFLIENVLWAALGLIAAGGVIAVIFVAPITFWLMKTRWRWRVWLFLSFGVPILVFAGFELYLIEEIAQSGYLIMVEAIVSGVIAFVLLFPLSSFLMVLRLNGWRLIYSEPWKRRSGSHGRLEPVSKPHPLDDE